MDERETRRKAAERGREGAGEEPAAVREEAPRKRHGDALLDGSGSRHGAGEPSEELGIRREGQG